MDDPATGRAFTCITSATVPRESCDLLRLACEAREISFSAIQAEDFDYAPERRLGPGAMLYAAAVSAEAGAVER